MGDYPYASHRARSLMLVILATVVAMVADGMTVREILDEHPDLEAEDIAECLRYAALAVQERELPLRQPA